MLERIRSTLGVPVTVTSRIPRLGGEQAVVVTTSDHAQGRAADIVARATAPRCKSPAPGAPVDALGIGQLIYERFGSTSWVHAQHPRARQESEPRSTTITSAGTQLGVQEVCGEP